MFIFNEDRMDDIEGDTEGQVTPDQVIFFTKLLALSMYFNTFT